MRATARRTRRSHRPPDRPGDPRLRRAALDAIHFAAVLDRSASTRSCLPVLAEPAPPVGSPVRPRGRGATASGTAHHFAVRAAPCPQTVAPGRRRHLPPSQPRYPVSPATQSPPHPHGTPTRNASSTLAPANRCPTGNQGQAAPVAPGIDRLLRQPPRFLCAAMLRRIDTLTTDIAALDVSIDELITPFADAVVRLDEIPGIGQRSAQELVAEIGVRMTAFPTAAHLVPWARLPPHRQTVSRPRQDRVHRQRQPHGSPMPSARSSPDWPARTPSSATATAAWPGDAARNGPSSRSATPSSRSSGTPCPTRTHAPIRVSHSAPRLQRVATCSTADRSRQARGPRPSGSSARDLLCPAVAEGEVDDGARCLIPQWPSREGTDVLFVVQCEINPAVEQASTKAAIRGVGASPSPLRYVPYNSSNILPAAASSAGRCPTQPGRHSRA